MTDLFILRHGETEWNVAGRLQGHLDSPLTSKGVIQARRQGAILARILPPDVTVLSSPSPRALRTARIALPDHAIVQDARLMEIALGQWTGQTIAALTDTNYVAAHPVDPHLWKFAAPGGETLEVMVARCHGVLTDLTGPTVLVTHGVTSRVLRCLALGLPPESLSAMPGGQGVVHHITGGTALVLTDA